MPKKLIGRFYFKLTSNGNLIGEYSENYSKKFPIKTEGAYRESSDTGFVGIYKTSWHETDEASPVTLKIFHKPGTSNLIYNIEWIENGIITFWGEGMLCDDILIGDYRDFENI